ncbi:50S ribosomal protein L15 [Candidatus Uhrbacteria bacterium]|nr:50S ribosomal protein L15 [Candidatus Uhrbacteria bacterium]
MALHTLTPYKNAKKKAKRIGRGLGSSHGTYATRGMKGQRSRSGGSKGLKLFGLRQTLLRVPKLRGFKSLHAKSLTLNVKDLELFNSGTVVNPGLLVQHGLVRPLKGKTFSVKILADGKVTKKLTIEGCLVSESARKKIEAAGGTVNTKHEIRNSKK